MLLTHPLGPKGAHWVPSMVSMVLVGTTPLICTLQFINFQWRSGAFASPLVCQSVLAAGWTWPQYYYTSIGLSVVNLVFLVTVFHTTCGEFEREREEGLALSATQEELPNEVENIGAHAQVMGETIEMRDISNRNRRRQPSGNMPKSSKHSSIIVDAEILAEYSFHPAMKAALSIPYVWVFMIFLMVYTGR
jgi:hypothetical protein